MRERAERGPLRRSRRHGLLKVMEALPRILRPGRTVAGIQREAGKLLTGLGATGVRNGSIHYTGPMDAPLG